MTGTCNIDSYDWVVINSSGGKDSQAMLDYLVECADSECISRDRLVVVHADLGRVEWRGTRELAERQAHHYGLRFESMKRPQGDLLEHVRHRGMWPSSTIRYCTSDHKRGQVSKIVTMLCRELKELGRPMRVLNCLGIRSEESPARAKKARFQRNARLTGAGTVKVVDDWFPIFDWTVGHVWDRIRSSGVDHHRAYDLGMPRLSCVFCVFAPRNALLIAGEHNRELLDEYVRTEREIDHTFRKDFRIAEIRSSLDAGERGCVTAEETACWNM